MVETVPNQDPSQSITWEDVVAVAKVMGVAAVQDEWYSNEYLVFRAGSCTAFSDPTAALEFITAEEHPIETKYANILRTKP